MFPYVSVRERVKIHIQISSSPDDLAFLLRERLDILPMLILRLISVPSICDQNTWGVWKVTVYIGFKLNYSRFYCAQMHLYFTYHKIVHIGNIK